MVYYHKDVNPAAGPHGPPHGRPVITSVRVEVERGYEKVEVWSRGGRCGLLLVGPGDGDKIAALLIPEHERLERV